MLLQVLIREKLTSSIFRLPSGNISSEAAVTTQKATIDIFTFPITPDLRQLR
jgi:hypothetical protein